MRVNPGEWSATCAAALALTAISWALQYYRAAVAVHLLALGLITVAGVALTRPWRNPAAADHTVPALAVLTLLVAVMVGIGLPGDSFPWLVIAGMVSTVVGLAWRTAATRKDFAVWALWTGLAVVPAALVAFLVGGLGAPTVVLAVIGLTLWSLGRRPPQGPRSLAATAAPIGVLAFGLAVWLPLGDDPVLGLVAIALALVVLIGTLALVGPLDGRTAGLYSLVLAAALAVDLTWILPGAPIGRDVDIRIVTGLVIGHLLVLVVAGQLWKPVMNGGRAAAGAR